MQSPMIFSKQKNRYDADLSVLKSLDEELTVLYMHEYEDFTSGSIPSMNNMFRCLSAFMHAYFYLSKKEANPLHASYKTYSENDLKECLNNLTVALEKVLDPSCQFANEDWYAKGLKGIEGVPDNKSGKLILAAIRREIANLKSSIGITPAPDGSDSSNEDTQYIERAPTTVSTEAPKSSASTMRSKEGGTYAPKPTGI